MTSKNINYTEYMQLENSPVYRKPRRYGGIIFTEADREAEKLKRKPSPTGGISSDEFDALRKERIDNEISQMKTQNERLTIQIYKTDIENTELHKKNEALLKELIDAKIEIANLRTELDKFKGS